MSVNPADLRGPFATCFDVGAFQGDFARACIDQWPDTVVHSFEPLAGTPDDVPAKPNVTTYPNWLWHPVALGNTKQTVTMHRNVFLPSSSVLPMAELHETAFPYTKGATAQEVDMRRLADYADLVVTPALLKIDVQGYELEVLRGADSYLGMFDAVVLEVNHATLYDGAPTPEQLANYLVSFGFRHRSRVDALHHPKHPGMLLQSDELWVRP